VIKFTGFMPFVNVAVCNQPALRQEATVALSELCSEPVWCRGILEAFGEMIKSNSAVPGYVAMCLADISTIPSTQRVLVQSGLTQTLQPLWRESNDLSEKRHVVNALGNCASEIKAASDPLLAEIGTFLNAQQTVQDQALLFCSQWAVQNFAGAPTVPQGVVLDKKLPFFKLLPDRLQARNDTYSFQSATGMAAVDQGRWQFEVTMVSDGQHNGNIHIGWARSDSSIIDGVGNTELSYGFDAALSHFWNDRSYTKYGTERAKVGSVIGCYFNLETGEIGFMLDGVNMGVAFSVPVEQRQLPLAFFCPAISLGRFQQCTVNFGAQALQYPLEGFSPIAAAPRQPI
jgi:hypothetical protein